MVDYLHTIPGDGSRYRYSCHWPRCRSSIPGSINVELERLLGIHKPPETVDLRLKGWEKLELWKLLVWPTCTKVGVMISLFYMYVYIYTELYICVYVYTLYTQSFCLLNYRIPKSWWFSASQLLKPPKKQTKSTCPWFPIRSYPLEALDIPISWATT